jgi:hypothetical protein
LITIGTPHRGSVKAVDFLANGHRVLFADFTDVVRSLTSVYQLLPRYSMVEENQRFCRVTETCAEIPGIDRKRAADGLRFHDEIEVAVDARPLRGYELIPIVGTWQPTMQSARLGHGRLTVDALAPTWTQFPEGDGDGTVPRVSAVPIEHSSAWLNTFVAERHSSLQNHAGILQDLQDRLVQSQVKTGHIRGALAAQPAPALALHVDDLYAHDERIEVRVMVKNMEAGDVTTMHVKVTSAANGETVHEGPCAASDGAWSRVFPPLLPGTYRVEVTATSGPPRALDSVHDVFAVAER